MLVKKALMVPKICVEVESECLAKYSKEFQKHFLFIVLVNVLNVLLSDPVKNFLFLKDVSLAVSYLEKYTQYILTLNQYTLLSQRKVWVLVPKNTKQSESFLIFKNKIKKEGTFKMSW